MPDDTCDDERRVEIEAVARFLAHAYGDQDFDETWHRKIAGQVLDRVRDARGDDEAALGSMWTIMQTQFERGRIPECHGPTRDDARKMLAGFRRVAARDAR
jgi:hypothetical protein